MSKNLEKYEDEVYAEIKQNYNKAVASGTSPESAARNANYRRSTAKVAAARRKSKNNSKLRKMNNRHITWKNNTKISILEFETKLKEYENKVRNTQKEGVDTLDELAKIEKEIEARLLQFRIAVTRQSKITTADGLGRVYYELVHKLSNILEITVKYHNALLDLYNFRYNYDKTAPRLNNIRDAIRDVEKYMEELESRIQDARQKGKKAFDEYYSWKNNYPR